MYEELVAIDIQTTGPDPRRDEIFELAAVKITGGRLAKSFAAVADPGIDVPLRVRKDLGIGPDEIEAAPPLSTVFARFIDFVGKRLCVAHEADLKRKFLDSAAYGSFESDLLDTLDLARLLLPAEERHDLEHLARKFNLGPAAPPRAPLNAALTARLWQALMTELDELPLPVLDAIMGLVERVDWPLKPLFQQAHARRYAEAFGKKLSLADCLPDFSPVINEAQERKAERHKAAEEEEPEPPALIDANAIVRLFGPDGVFSKHLPNFEPRREQARMAKAVAHSFNNAKHLMVEAGTGTGKSLAYLVPSIYWATRNACPVVISTYTKALQAQLFHKDIPMVTEMLDQPFRASVIKGRPNYLCPRKLLYLLSEAEREIADAERLALLPVITWAAATQTGDIAENTGFQAARTPGLWDRLYATGDECRGRACEHWKHCFLLKARAQAQLSDIVVANHAVVFSETALSSSPVLPDHKHLIFDEAHNVESVATDNLGHEVDRWIVLRPLHRLYRVRERERDRAGRGLLTNILYQLKRGRETSLTETEQAIVKTLEGALRQVLDAEPLLEAFLASLEPLFTSGEAGARVRYSSEFQPSETWGPAFRQKELLISALARLVKDLDFVREEVAGLEREFLYQQDLMYQLDAQLNVLREIIDDLEFLMKGGDEDYVYWAECLDARMGSFRLAAAPIEVGKLLKDLLYERKDTIIFSSATLTVADKFDFFRSRLGLDLLDEGRVLELSLGTSFDFERQVLLCVPNFLPEPVYRSDDFNRAVGRFLVELHVATQGRGLILFTSYDMLSKVYATVKDELEREKIVVLGQGIDGASDQLLTTFRRVVESVLLGTQSFWEGVDVPGESLSCLTLTKLPFQVYTDPIITARCEAVEAAGRSSFTEFSVPSAVIRFKQGFGRLIRSRTDRGVVVVLDKRIITKRYGSYFLKSLPLTHRVYSDKDKLLDDVRQFLGPPGKTGQPEGT